MHRLVHRQPAGIDRGLRTQWRLVRIVDAGEALDLAAPCAPIESLGIARLADLRRRRHVNLVETADPLHAFARIVARAAIGRNHRADADAAVTCDFGGDIADPAHVQLAVGAGEGQAGRQHFAHHVAVEYRRTAPAFAFEMLLQRSRDSGLAGTRQSGQEQGETRCRHKRGTVSVGSRPIIAVRGNACRKPRSAQLRKPR